MHGPGYTQKTINLPQSEVCKAASYNSCLSIEIEVVNNCIIEVLASHDCCVFETIPQTQIHMYYTTFDQTCDQLASCLPPASRDI